MDFKRLTILDLSNESVTFVVLIVWAYFSRDVWALVGGAVIGQLYLVRREPSVSTRNSQPIPFKYK